MIRSADEMRLDQGRDFPLYPPACVECGVAFRDDNEALRARVEQLEAQLESAQANIEAQQSLIDALRAHGDTVRTIERERNQALARLAALQAAETQRLRNETPRQRARREKEELRERLRQEQAQRALGTNASAVNLTTRAFLAALITVLALGLFALTRESPALEEVHLDRNASPTEGTLTTWQGVRRYEGASIPRVSTQELAAPCAGFVATAPTLTLSVGDVGFVALEAAENDALIVLEGPSNSTLCDVSEGAEHARLETMLLAGTYRVWVGRVHASTSPMPHALSVMEGSAALPDFSHGSVVIPVITTE